jgi:serine/threonine protein kinase/class 3 adenylate cyclase
MPSERIQRQIEALLDEADAAIREEDWTTVAARARAALAADPENEDARSYLAMAERGLADGGSPSAGGSARPTAAEESTGPQLPDSFVGGRYRVERFLGDGGKKRVFLAHDTTLDRPVAFALLRSEGLDATGRQRLVREAQSMARIGTHPNLVAIHDIGEEDGTPFLVEEFMPGGDLAIKLRDHPPTLAETLRLGMSVCDALVFIHDQQLIHRDLKPSNVFLTEDGTAKVGDFGLAVSLDRTRLTTEGSLIGTAAYMPPEQALGGDVTARSDIYSLGAMLYELVTGRPPFVGDDPTSVISQHINTPPVAPSWHSEHCPPALEELILRCLAKSPEERPESAIEVRAALASVDPEAKSATHSGSGANPLDRLARGVFVGRDAELDRLRQSFDRAYSGSGNLAMLVGEPGIGKTRTTEELATYAQMRGSLVLWGRTHESAGMPPYWPWLQVGNAVSAEELTAIGPEMPPQATSELSRIFAWLRDQPNYTPPEDVAEPEVAQFRLFDAYATFLRVLSERQPLVIVLDDLHWADKPSLLLLQFVARELRGRRILVVGTFRDTDLVRTHPLSETLAELNRDPGFERIVLRGLTRDEVLSYIRASANQDPDSRLVDRIHEETEGNPFFLSEVVQLMAQEGQLNGGGTLRSVSEIALPDGVREALGRRLDGLSEEGQELLQVAAIVGREFAYEVLTILGDHDDDMLLGLIEESLAARVIEETERAGRYRFTHALMQETLLDELSTTRRVRLHGRVAEALEQRWGELADERASRLAQHFMESATLTASHSERALHYSLIAGHAAEAQAAFGEASRHYRACLSLIDDADMAADPAILVPLLVSLGRSERNASEPREAWRHLMRSVDIARGASDAPGQAEAVLELVQIWAPASRLNALLDAAIAALDEDEDPRLLGMLLAERANVGRVIDPGDMEAVLAAGEQARELVRRHELADVEGLLLYTFEAPMAVMVDADYDRATEFIERSIVLLDEAGILREASFARRMLATLLGEVGDVTRALEQSEEAVQTAHSRGIRNEESLGLMMLATNLWRRGELERAVGALDGDPDNHYLIRTMRAGFFAAFGEADRARRELPATADLPPVPELLPQAYAMQVPVLYTLGDEQRLTDVLTLWHDGYYEMPWVLRGTSWDAVAWALLGLGHGDWAREVLEDVEPFLADGKSFSLTAAVLAIAAGELDRAEALLEQAVELAQREGLALQGGLTDVAAGALARARGSDREALAAFDRAQQRFQDLGAAGLVEQVLRYKIDLQGAGSSDSQTSLVSLTTSVEEQRPNVASAAAPDGTVTLLFSDIEDSTAMNVELGDDAWMQLLAEHNRIVRDAIASTGGFEVKTEGDAFMVAFGSARDAVRCAQAMQRGLDARNVATSANGRRPLRIRIGLHTGEPVREADDFYGTHVVLAARICSQASGGEILVSSLLSDLVASSGEFELTAREPVALKGLEGQHVTYEVGWS